VIPVSQWDSGRDPFVGAVGFRVERAAGVVEAGRAFHAQGAYDEQVLRALVVKGRLLTLSEGGIEVNDLGTLAEQAWLPFP
jgi:hypothetical protein